MKTTRILGIALALLLPLVAPAALNEGVITYSGFLHKADASAETAPQTLVFTLYDAATLGNVLWTQTANSGPLDSLGWFSVVLGASPSAFPPDGFLSQTWLGIKVGAEAEMTPRTKIGAAPHALTVDYGGVSGCTTANQILQWSGTAWTCIATPAGGGGGGVTGVTATAPLVSSGGTAPVISMGANPTFTGTVTATTFSGDLSGNASTATSATTAGSATTATTALSANAVAAGVIAPSRLAGTVGATGQVPSKAATDGWTWVTPGTVTGVTAGAGLTGGGASGAVTLAAAFAGSGGDLGAASTSARSDHVHPGLANAVSPPRPAFTAISDNLLHTLMTVTVTCPAAGMVLLVASGHTAFTAQSTVVDIGISTSGTVLGNRISHGWLAGTTILSFYLPFGHTALLPGAAGSNTYYLNAQRQAAYAGGNVNVDPASFVAVCIRN